MYGKGYLGLLAADADNDTQDPQHVACVHQPLRVHGSKADVGLPGGEVLAVGLAVGLRVGELVGCELLHVHLRHDDAGTAGA